MKLAFLAGYRGQNFAGSQYQPDKRTVAAVLDAIRKGKIESSCKKTPIRTYTSQSFHNVVRKVRRQTSRLKPRRMR